MTAYYNEIDPYAAHWLRNLIDAGQIAPGDVDERSIEEVSHDDLVGYSQCHFFAGIGGWSHALRLAGVGDDRPVWTGSCPCQPFSIAGKQRGVEDRRHLWPAFFRLIQKCRPATVFGEQVAGSAGYAWWDHVAADLEDADYSVAAANLGAHSVGAPHKRQRLYWMADAGSSRLERYQPKGSSLRIVKNGTPAERGHNGLPPWLSIGPDHVPHRTVDGVFRHMGTVRAYGNAIVPQVAAAFVTACMEYRP